MVTINIRGGAGNQMFQYAFAKALARAKNTDFRLDLTQLLDRTPRSITFRNYELGAFRIAPCFTLLSRLAMKLSAPLIYLGVSYALTRAKDIAGIQKRVVERKIGFHPEIFSIKGDVYLDGWWQSEKYFKSIEREVREDFSFRAPLTSELKVIGERMGQDDSVCLHVRRGDYVTNPNASREIGFVGKNYYERALEFIVKRVPSPRFFVFSDDIPWCRENLRTGFLTEFIGADYAGGRWYEHLELMTLCKHFVIANSSFSWWAAWLGSRPGKIVIAPKRWFNDPDLSSKDVVPESWIRV
ncbi:MAG: alpha-1,2-fucosyltransferase [Patescibacteria group bacterium]